MTDLVERVLAVIGETEQYAKDTMSTNGRASILGGDWLPAQWVYEDGRIRTAERRGVLVVAATWAREGAHISHNDPAAILRRCAADRKIVDLYRIGLNALSVAQGTILAGACKVRLGAYEKAVRALADGYGITVEEQ